MRSTIYGFDHKKEDVRLITDPGAFRTARPTSVSAFQNKIAQLAGTGQVTDSRYNEFRRMIHSLLEIDPVRRLLPQDEDVQRLIEHFGVFLRGPDLVEGVTDVFMRYKVAAFDLFDQALSQEDVRSRLGDPPWQVLNDILEQAQFPYKVKEPRVGVATDYVFALEALESDLTIDPSDLSSGERVILATILWLYGSEHTYALPKLLLLDEPDAHLHPSMTRQFFNVIDNVLVRRFGIRVIITTHSPSTVALAPEHSIFEMRRHEPRIVRSRSRWGTVGLLTEGLLTVGPDTKYVVTEDVDDKEFFEATQRVLQRRGPLTDMPPSLAPTPSLVFIPASLGERSGGKTKVDKWVDKFAGTYVHGIVDRDRNNTGNERLHPLGRYEFENYLADPVVIFAYLLGRNQGLDELQLGLRIGDESRLRTFDQSNLQRIVDSILGRLKPLLATKGVLTITQADDVVQVSVVNGPTLDYPQWFLFNKGTRFMQAIGELYGPNVDWKELLLAYERAAWVPAELLDILQTVQQS